MCLNYDNLTTYISVNDGKFALSLSWGMASDITGRCGENLQCLKTCRKNSSLFNPFHVSKCWQKCHFMVGGRGSLRHNRQMWGELSVQCLKTCWKNSSCLTLFMSQHAGKTALSCCPCFLSVPKNLDLRGFQCPDKQLKATVYPYVACALPQRWQ